MAITPIDLQTLFTQLDKVGRSQISQREGQAIQQAIQGIQIQKKTEEQVMQVNEAQDTGEGAEKVNDNSHRQGGGAKSGKRQKENAEEEEKTPAVLRDLSLGKTIDISL